MAAGREPQLLALGLASSVKLKGPAKRFVGGSKNVEAAKQPWMDVVFFHVESFKFSMSFFSHFFFEGSIVQ